MTRKTQTSVKKPKRKLSDHQLDKKRKRDSDRIHKFQIKETGWLGWASSCGWPWHVRDSDAAWLLEQLSYEVREEDCITSIPDDPNCYIPSVYSSGYPSRSLEQGNAGPGLTRRRTLNHESPGNGSKVCRCDHKIESAAAKRRTRSSAQGRDCNQARGAQGESCLEQGSAEVNTRVISGYREHKKDIFWVFRYVLISSKISLMEKRYLKVV